MSAKGHSRRFRDVPATSAVTPIADVIAIAIVMLITNTNELAASDGSFVSHHLRSSSKDSRKQRTVKLL